MRLTVTRGMLLNGEHKPAGTRLELPALAAADVLESGRAELTNPADLQAVVAARRGQVAALLRKGAQPQPDGWPWHAGRLQ